MRQGVHQRLHAPAGLDRGGRSPEPITLSIVAGILAFLHGSSARRAARPARPPRERSRRRSGAIAAHQPGRAPGPATPAPRTGVIGSAKPWL